MSTMTTMEKWAARYREEGYSVIPTTPVENGNRKTGKRPAVPWEEYQTRLPTDHEIHEWFAETRYGIAVVCGKFSGLVVVDCDDQEAVQQALRVCEPTEWVVETGGGGAHLWYRHPGKFVRNRQKINGLKLDLRGDGGYVVAPPSPHWSGRKYKFIATGRMPVYDPAWFPVESTDYDFHLEGADCDLNRMRKRARAYIAKIDSIEGQGGDKQLLRAATALMVKFNLPPEIALEELKYWNAYRAVPPWPEKRLEYKLAEAVRLNK